MDATRRAKIHFVGSRIVPAASFVLENSIRKTESAREQMVKPVWISLNKSLAVSLFCVQYTCPFFLPLSFFFFFYFTREYTRMRDVPCGI